MFFEKQFDLVEDINLFSEVICKVLCLVEFIQYFLINICSLWFFFGIGYYF